MYIADAKGLFAKENVSVTLKIYSVNDESNADFAGKKLDGDAFVFPDALSQVANGIPAKVVWVTDSSVGGDQIVGNSSAATLKDLKGKKVGVSYGTFGHVFLVSLLAKVGLTTSDITIVDLPAEKIPDALAKGQIDAGHTWEPYASQAVTAGAHIIATSKETPGIIADVMAFQDDFVSKRPDDVKAFLRALVAARTWWDANPQEGNQIVAKVLGVKPDEVPGQLDGVQIYTLQDNLKAFDKNVNGTQSLYQAAQTSVDVLTNAGVIKKALDLNTILQPSFVQALTAK
jgi:NitT/TauT family transport system substrate-binding protein